MRIFLSLMLFLFPALSPALAQVTLLAFGDSLTAGYGLREHESFPAQLEKRLNGKAKIINAGVSGDTTQSGLERVDWLLTPEIKGVILELGANDMLRGMPILKAKANLEKLIETFQAKNIKVFLCGMLAAPNLGESYARPFNQIYQDLAVKYKLDFDPFFMEGVAGNAGLLLKDGLHPNAEGAAFMATRLAPKIEQFVESIK